MTTNEGLALNSPFGKKWVPEGQTGRPSAPFLGFQLARVAPRGVMPKPRQESSPAIYLNVMDEPPKNSVVVGHDAVGEDQHSAQREQTGFVRFGILHPANLVRLRNYVNKGR
jgi:hypothetical protein